MSKSDHEQVLAFHLRALAPDFPEAQREYRFHPTRRWRFDWAFPLPGGAGGVAIEVDGGQFAPGGGRHNRDSDRWKMSEAAARGWLVLRFSGQMLEADPARCVELVRSALVVTGVINLQE